jgi:pimeloyl-ACP methyl ester carboxylesterase
MPAPDPHPLPGRDVVVSAGGPGNDRQAQLRIHVAEHGRAAGRLPLLMLAEPPATSYLWRDVARDLEADHRSFMPDLPGCGASERPPNRRAYALDAQAQTMRALLDDLAVPRAAVVASGIAGLVALELAAVAPSRVAALILVGTVLHADSWPVAGVLPLLPVPSGEVLLSRLGGSRGRGKLAALLSTPDGPDLDHYLEPLAKKGGARSLLRWLRAVDMGLARGALDLVRAAPPPTLVLWGSGDHQLSPEYGRRVAGELAATWVPIAGAGHLVARERPERVAEEIAAFVSGLE